MSLILTIVAAYLTLCGLLFFAQRSQIYFPVPESTALGAEAIRIESGKESLKVWVIKRPGPMALIYFGGNAEDVGGNAYGFTAAFPEHTIYLVNYRGYGGSSGRPSEQGINADALAVHDYASARQQTIDVMGRSLGGGVATYLASQRPVGKLVLVTPFDSMVKVAKHYYWWLPVGLLLRDRYDAAGIAPEVKSSVLVVIAEEDEIIPRARSDALAKAFKEGQAEVAVIAGVGHNSLDLSPDYLRQVGQFLYWP